MAAKKHKQAKKRREGARPHKIHLNIGTVIYLAVFIYLIISLILYFTETHVTSYQVISGPLSSNENYTALALREETVVYADTDGYIHYYVGDVSKVGKNSPVCSIGSSEDAGMEGETTAEQKKEIRAILADYAVSYDADRFSEMASTRYALENELLGDASSVQAAAGAMLSAEDGMVVYTTDGYEGYAAEDVSEDWFDLKAYKGQSHVSSNQVKAGDPVYKLVTSEEWQLVVPVSDRQFAKLSTMTSIKVKFLQDGQTQNGTIETRQIQGKNYAFITLQNGMARYADERFLNVELVTNIESGLKIPNTAITKKEFYKIPAAYRTSGGDSNSYGVLREVLKDDGTMTTEFVDATLYTDPQEDLVDGETPVYYYIDKADLEAGDVLIASDSQTKYTVQETENLKGVYRLNLGYAVFCPIRVEDQNEEFTIIASGTSRGIDMYDYIAADASTVQENQIME